MLMMQFTPVVKQVPFERVASLYRVCRCSRQGMYLHSYGQLRGGKADLGVDTSDHGQLWS